MKKKSEKFLSVLISFLMFFTILVSYPVNAVTKSNTIDKNSVLKQIMEKHKVSGINGKIDSFNTNKTITNSDEDVRLIVEVDQPAAINYAKDQKVQKVITPALTSKILASQKPYKDAVAKKVAGVKFRKSYTVLLNGFSIEAKRKDIAAIETIFGVKHVTEVKKFYSLDDKPEMAYAKELTNLKPVYDYGYKGEGMLVSIIDTGIDTTHKDMRITNATPKYDKDSINTVIANKGLKGQYYTSKVVYGYNYADENNTIIDTTGSMHGMHVAGIVAANCKDEDLQSNGIRGVAPETQLLAMKVFSNDNNFASAFSDDIVKAIEDSVALGADVINMSLGSTAAFQDPLDAELVAVKNANTAGTVCVISAGNSYYSTSPYKFGDVVDTGLVGAPGLAHESLQVASYENVAVTAPAITYTYGTNGSEDVLCSIAKTPYGVLDNPEGYDVVDCGIGMAGSFDKAEGKIALIKRGTLTFSQKIINAQNAGAIGVIIYNQSLQERSDGGDSLISMLTDSNCTIPSIFIGNTDGVNLAADMTMNNNVKVIFREGNVGSAINPKAGDMSDFTSWGPTSNLDFKPQITAPGGNIWSTVNNNQYESMSGTSMAAPHMSGIEALIKQHIKNDFTKVTNTAELEKTLAVNTAIPQMDPLTQRGLPFSPRRQGAGLANAGNAIGDKVTVTCNNEATAALRQITPGSGKYVFILDLKNYSSTDETYEVSSLTNGVMTEQDEFYIRGMSYDKLISGSSVTFSTPQVTVPANGTVPVVVTLNIPVDTPEDIFAEGFIRFVPASLTAPEIGIPYMGFYGQWDRPAIFDKPDWDWNNTWIGTETVNLTDGENIYSLLAEQLGYGTNFDPIKLAFNPNLLGENWSVIPSYTLFRNVKTMITNITDANGKIIRKLAVDNKITKDVINEEDIPCKLLGTQIWDGKQYKLGRMVTVPDGQYYYSIKACIDYPLSKYQELKMPIQVDTASPTLSNVQASVAPTGTTVTLNALDLIANSTKPGSGVCQFEFYNISTGEEIYPEVVDNLNGNYTLTSNSNNVINDSVWLIVTDYAGNSEVAYMGDLLNESITISSPVQDQTIEAKEVPVDFTMTDSLKANASKVSVYTLIDGEESYLGDSLDMATYVIPQDKLIDGENTIIVRALNDSGAIIKEAQVKFTLKKIVNLNMSISSDSQVQQGVLVNTGTAYISGMINYKPDVFEINGVPVELSSDLSFYAPVTIANEGNNKVKIYAKRGMSVLDYSITLYKDSLAPVISIPGLDANSNTLYVTVDNAATEYKVNGIVNDGLGISGYKVFVNGDAAYDMPGFSIPPTTIDQTTAAFTDIVTLDDTITDIQVVATDAAGNSTVKHIVVTKGQRDSNAPKFVMIAPASTLVYTRALTYNIKFRISDETMEGIVVKVTSINGVSKDITITPVDGVYTYTANSGSKVIFTATDIWGNKATRTITIVKF